MCKNSSTINAYEHTAGFYMMSRFYARHYHYYAPGEGRGCGSSANLDVFMMKAVRIYYIFGSFVSRSSCWYQGIIPITPRLDLERRS